MENERNEFLSKNNISIIAREELFNSLKELTDLLRDAVKSGASVGYLEPLSEESSAEYWLSVKDELEEGRREILVLRGRNSRIIGSVQLSYPVKPNASHRAEIEKLMVFSDLRRQGYGEKLMQAAEELARSKGKTLLILDTRKGDPSEHLYTRLGYIKAGEIPEFARSVNGELHTTVLFYKQLNSA